MIDADVKEALTTISDVIAVLFTDPGADRLVFWDESGNAIAYLELGTNLSITGTVLNAAAGYTDEQAQDAVGSILLDSGDLDWLYDDATPYITASILKSFITGKTNVAAAATDSVVLSDASDSDNLKKATIQSIIDLMPAGYSDEQAQDAVGNILTNSGDISWLYSDATPFITASILKGMITGKTSVPAALSDQILISDASDSDNLKRVSVQSIVDAVALASSIASLIVAAGTGNDSTLKVGQLEFEDAGSSGLLLWNLYWDGANFIYRATGEASAIHMEGDTIYLLCYASGTAATAAGGYSPGTAPFAINPSSAVFTVPVTVPAEAYGAGWSGDLTAPTKDDIYDYLTGLGGTYTPTLTGDTNVSSSTAYQCQWLRAGNTVTVSGKFDITPTSIAETILRIELPVTSNIGAVEDVAGMSRADDYNSFNGGTIKGDAANNTANFYWFPSGSGARTIYFHFTYQVI